MPTANPDPSGRKPARATMHYDCAQRSYTNGDHRKSGVPWVCDQNCTLAPSLGQSATSVELPRADALDYSTTYNLYEFLSM